MDSPSDDTLRVQSKRDREFKEWMLDDDAYICDRSHGDDDIRCRRRDMLEWIWKEDPELLPNHNIDENDLHHID